MPTTVCCVGERTRGVRARSICETAVAGFCKPGSRVAGRPALIERLTRRGDGLVTGLRCGARGFHDARNYSYSLETAGSAEKPQPERRATPHPELPV